MPEGAVAKDRHLPALETDVGCTEYRSVVFPVPETSVPECFPEDNLNLCILAPYSGHVEGS